ncbi:MAG: PASTA domain-containing protein [Gaiellaceae bacterium]
MPTAMEPAQPPPPPPPPPHWYREPGWAFLVVLLLIVGGILAYFILRDRDAADGQDRVAVPQVVGQREAGARAILERVGFEVEVVRSPSERREGVVFGQDPAAGSRLALGKTVAISVSTGPEETETETVTETETETEAKTETETVTAPPPATTAMPDVVGLNYREASEQAFDAGLIGDTYPVPSAEPRGTVVAQNPSPGTEVEEGSVVRLNVSLGEGARAQREVPDLTGPELRDAHELCLQAGLTCRTIFRQAPSPEEEGEVLDQRRAPGTRLPVLAQITLYSGR